MEGSLEKKRWPYKYLRWLRRAKMPWPGRPWTGRRQKPGPVRPTDLATPTLTWKEFQPSSGLQTPQSCSEHVHHPYTRSWKRLRDIVKLSVAVRDGNPFCFFILMWSMLREAFATQSVVLGSAVWAASENFLEGQNYSRLTESGPTF